MDDTTRQNSGRRNAVGHRGLRATSAVQVHSGVVFGGAELSLADRKTEAPVGAIPSHTSRKKTGATFKAAVERVPAPAREVQADNGCGISCICSSRKTGQRRYRI